MSIATYIVSPLGTSDHKLRSHLQARDGGVPSGSDSLSSDWSLNLLYIYWGSHTSRGKCQRSHHHRRLKASALKQESGQV